MGRTSLQSERRQKGLTQVQVAKCVGISEVSYQRIEYGTQEPSVTTAILIADVLGVRSYQEFKSLFGGEAVQSKKT